MSCKVFFARLFDVIFDCDYVVLVHIKAIEIKMKLCVSLEISTLVELVFSFLSLFATG